MTLPDLFTALNARGLTLARLGDRITLRGATGAITSELTEAVALHKPALLSLLPEQVGQEGVDTPILVEPNDSLPTEVVFAQLAQAVRVEALGAVTASETLKACEEWDQLVEARDWRDWRLDWIAEWGAFHVRLHHCQDPEARQRLAPLADLPIPQSESEWKAQRQMIDNTFAELRRLGKEVLFPWPKR